MYFTGEGICYKYKAFDAKNKVQVDILEQGKMIGEVEATFDCQPLTSIESRSYCAIGMINYRHYKDMLIFNPLLKQSFINKIL